MIVSLHVHDDGDIEMTKHDTRRQAESTGDLVFEDDEQALRDELTDYGVPADRAKEALEELETLGTAVI